MEPKKSPAWSQFEQDEKSDDEEDEERDSLEGVSLLGSLADSAEIKRMLKEKTMKGDNRTFEIQNGDGYYKPPKKFRNVKPRKKAEPLLPPFAAPMSPFIDPLLAPKIAQALAPPLISVNLDKKTGAKRKKSNGTPKKGSQPVSPADPSGDSDSLLYPFPIKRKYQAIEPSPTRTPVQYVLNQSKKIITNPDGSKRIGVLIPQPQSQQIDMTPPPPLKTPLSFPVSRHVKFFKSVLPNLLQLDEDEIIHYQSEVLATLNKIFAARPPVEEPMSVSQQVASIVEMTRPKSVSQEVESIVESSASVPPSEESETQADSSADHLDSSAEHLPPDIQSAEPLPSDHPPETPDYESMPPSMSVPPLTYTELRTPPRSSLSPTPHPADYPTSMHAEGRQCDTNAAVGPPPPPVMQVFPPDMDDGQSPQASPSHQDHYPYP